MKRKTPVKLFNKENIDTLIKEMQKVGGELKSIVKYTRNKFEGADEKTKKKILAGLAGAAAVLAVLLGAKKMRRGCKCKK